MNTADRSLLIGSGILFTATLLTGKIVIDQIVAGPDRAPKTAAAAPSKKPLDDAVKCFGTLFGIYTLVKQVPVLLTEWGKYVD